jgi:hypothetical protein
MAKLNYTKARQREIGIKSYLAEQLENKVKGDFHTFKNAGLWVLKGKYYGQPVNKLPLDYLNWIINKFPGIHAGIAKKELQSRNSNT